MPPISRLLVSGGGSERVADLLHTPVLEFEGDLTAAEAARRMGEDGVRVALIRTGEGVGVITDESLRRRILAVGLDGSAPVSLACDQGAATIHPGASAVEASIALIEQNSDHLVVADEAGVLGVLTLRDLLSAGVARDLSVHLALSHAGTTTELVERASGIPALLADLFHRGLDSERVIGLLSTLLDATVGRAVQLSLAGASLDPSPVNYLLLGSTGRREAVLSSDADTAAVVADDLSAAEIDHYRDAFAEVDRLLAQVGLPADSHGTSAAQQRYCRTAEQWRRAATVWAGNPAEDKGAIMTSLLADSRVLLGQASAVPAVSPHSFEATMRMLLTEALAHPARTGSETVGLFRRRGSIDIKHDALLPVVNLARWSALSVGKTELSTVTRLRVAAGTAMLPEASAERLVEVFGAIQRLRLRLQLSQVGAGTPVTDRFSYDQLSPIDRSLIAEAVREINGQRRRMANIAAYVDVQEWAAQQPQPRAERV